jgi:hypothetical protein
MSGSVSPLTGARPADIVMLYNTWNPKPEMIPDDEKRAHPVAGQVGRIETANHEQIQGERDEHPDEPLLFSQHGNTKSLWATGRKP